MNDDALNRDVDAARGLSAEVADEGRARLFRAVHEFAAREKEAPVPEAWIQKAKGIVPGAEGVWSRLVATLALDSGLRPAAGMRSATPMARDLGYGVQGYEIIVRVETETVVGEVTLHGEGIQATIDLIAEGQRPKSVDCDELGQFEFARRPVRQIVVKHAGVTIVCDIPWEDQ